MIPKSSSSYQQGLLTLSTEYREMARIAMTVLAVLFHLALGFTWFLMRFTSSLPYSCTISGWQIALVRLNYAPRKFFIAVMLIFRMMRFLRNLAKHILISPAHSSSLAFRALSTVTCFLDWMVTKADSTDRIRHSAFHCLRIRWRVCFLIWIECNNGCPPLIHRNALLFV